MNVVIHTLDENKTNQKYFFPSSFLHSERTCPVNNNQCDPINGITHFNVGDAGASLYTTWLETKPWSVFRNATFGHGQMQIFNATTAMWTWHQNSNSESQISDSVVLTSKA
jgi:hypothetical protein